MRYVIHAILQRGPKFTHVCLSSPHQGDYRIVEKLPRKAKVTLEFIGLTAHRICDPVVAIPSRKQRLLTRRHYLPIAWLVDSGHPSDMAIEFPAVNDLQLIPCIRDLPVLPLMCPSFSL